MSTTQREDQIRQRQVGLAYEAASRWEKTLPARVSVRMEVAKKGPLLAESPDRARSFQRRESLRAVAQAVGERPRSGLGLERIVGATFDLKDLPSNEAAGRAGQPVARLIDPPETGIISQGFGTGFLVSPRLLITNHHVFPDKSSAAAVAHFGFEHDAKGLHAGTMFELDPDVFFLTDERLDFSLVAVRERSVDGHALQQFGFVPLIAATGKILMGQPVSIIQHPLGGPKQWAETENMLLFLSDDLPYLQYETDTLPGSSGSPVFNSFWEAVGLHHSGVPKVENGKIKTRTGQDWDEKTMSDDVVDWIANEGVRVSSLVGFLRVQEPDTAVARGLLAELLADTADPLEKKPVALENVEQGAFMPNLPTGPATINIVVNGNASFNINGGLTSVAPIAPQATAPEKTLRFDPKYSERGGYRPDFLAPNQIPLPTVTATRAGELFPDEAGNPLILKYHHMSIVMNKERRLLMWAAANVDYSEAKRPASGRSEFGADKWKADPRVPQLFQLEDSEFYVPAKKFDRGHIIRREDNCWGDNPLEQESANSDTFHWTNCTPQHEAFNRSSLAGVWGKLENHISEQSGGVEGSKMCIFAGPVLADDDLEHDFGAGMVKVPIRFWKIIAVQQRARSNDTPRLAVFGFVLDQSTPIREKGLEAFQVGEFKTFQRSLSEITKASGVEFPKVLLDAEVKRSRSGTIPLESLRDLEGLS
jgi:endonuclease G